MGKISQLAIAAAAWVIITTKPKIKQEEIFFGNKSVNKMSEISQFVIFVGALNEHNIKQQNKQKEIFLVKSRNLQ